MACITLPEAQEQLSAWLAANAAVAKGQSYTIKDRTLERADASKILKQIKYWTQVCNNLERGGIRTRRVVPRDL